jgi:Ca2+-binding RTX toxin-like protein
MINAIISALITGILAITMVTSIPVTSLVFAEDIEGTDGHDILSGTPDDDKIDSGDGGDEAFGESGDDKIKTGKGDDNNFGGQGDDKLNAGQGNDFLEGRSGADKFQCGSGYDTVYNFDETEGDKATGNCEQFQHDP